MSRRLNTLIVCMGIFTTMIACARSAGVADNTEVAVRTGASGLSELEVAPATRRLYGGKDWIGSEDRTSPDGRYVSMTDWTNGNLALHDLTTDSTLSLTHKRSWDDSDDFAETSVLSPDGKSVAYGWYSGSTDKFDLTVMSLSGPDSGRTRVIYQGSRLGFTAAQAWTPDGKNVLSAIELADKTNHIAVVPAFGGKSRRLKSFDWRYPNNLSVSPDGKWLAYDFPPNEASGDRDVFLLALDGSAESVVTKEKGDDFVVGWARDGSRLLYGSERGGTPGIWAVSVTNGKATGSPVLVRSDMWRMAPLGMMNTGKLAYMVTKGTRDAFTATLDSNTGEITSKPVAMNSPANANPQAIAWSPDGHQLAQAVVRGRSSGVYGPSDIIIRSIDRDESRRLSPQMSRILYVYWVPDGSTLVVRGADMKARWGIFSVDLQTAKMRTVAESAVPGFGRFLSLGADSKVGYFVNNNSQITLLDLATGGMRVLYMLGEHQSVAGMSVAPDGRQLAIGIVGGVYERGIIALLPVAGGIPHEIYRFGKSETINQQPGFTWSREGRELVFGVMPASLDNSVTELRALSLADGTLRSLRVPTARISAVRISPDSRRIVYTVNDVSGELWIMDEAVFSSKGVIASRR